MVSDPAFNPNLFFTEIGKLLLNLSPNLDPHGDYPAVKNKTKIFLSIFLIAATIIVAASLTVVTLLRLPFFYEQPRQGKFISFIILFCFYLLPVFIATIYLLLPHIDQYLKKSNLIFIITIIVLLTILLSLNSAHYWAVPFVHSVEICFDASNGEDNLTILELVDPTTNRLFSLARFGLDHYPIILDSGTCVNGQVMNLLSPLTHPFIGYQADVLVEENPPDGRFMISINDVPSIVTFNSDQEEETSTRILVRDGFGKGGYYQNPWDLWWFKGIKLLNILLSAVFITLSLFGITEHLFNFAGESHHHSNGTSNDIN